MIYTLNDQRLRTRDLLGGREGQEGSGVGVGASPKTKKRERFQVHEDDLYDV